MKKIVVALLFLFAVVVESNAQIIGGGEYTQTTTQPVTTNNNTNGLIKAGVIVLSTGGGLGLIFTIIGGVLYDDAPGLLWTGVAYIGVATAVGVPLLMAGKARQRRALAIQATPIMNYDFKVNNHLTLSTNLNVMSKSNLSSTKGLKRDYCPGAGLVLHF